MKKLFTLFIFLCAALSASADEDTNTYILAGTMTNWDENRVTMDTTRVKGVYFYTFEGLSATKEYEFKVKVNDDWGNSYPSDNYKFSLASASDVTIVYNSSTHAVFAYAHNDAHVVGSSDIMPNDWSLSDGNMSYDKDKQLFSYKLENKTLSVGCYEYNFYFCTGTGGTCWDFKKQSFIKNYDNSNSMVAIATAGTYDITFYYDPIEDRGWCEPKKTDATDSYTIYVKSDDCPRIYIWGDKVTSYGDKPYYNNWWNGSNEGLVGLPMECKKTVDGITYWTTTFYDINGFGWLLYNDGSQSGNMYANGDDYCSYDGVNTITPYPQLVIGTNGCWTHGKVIPQVGNDYTITETIPAYTQFLVKKGDTWYKPSSDTDVKHDKYAVASTNDWATFTTPLELPYTITWSSDLSELTVDYDEFVLDYFSEYGASYDPETYTMTATSDWQGIHCPISFDSGTTNDDFLIIKKQSGKVDLYVEVRYRDGSYVNKTFGADATNCIMEIDNSKSISDIQLKAVKAGEIVFEDLYLTPAVATAELKTAAGGYATFSSNKAVAIPEGITAMYPSTVNGTSITWTNFTKGIPAGQGALLKGTAGKTYNFPPAISTDEVPYNETITMKPIDAKVAEQPLPKIDTTGYTNYILWKSSNVLGFFKVNTNGSYVNEGTAYLKVKDGAISTTTPAPAFFPLTGETTAIDNLTTEPAQKGEEKIYSLDGRRIVGQPTAKGIYIVNGKKLLKK